MGFLTILAFGMLLLLGVVMGPVLGQDELVSRTTRGFATITTTVAFSSAKFTRTVTRTVTTYYVPTHSTYTHTTSTPFIPQLQPTGINTNTGPPHIGHEASPSTTGRLIGLLFAGGTVLLVFTFALLAFCVRRHKKIQQKRIQDWVEVSALHDRHSVLGNCGTPAAEMAAWRDGKIGMEEAEMKVPEPVVVRDAKLGGLSGVAE